MSILNTLSGLFTDMEIAHVIYPVSGAFDDCPDCESGNIPYVPDDSGNNQCVCVLSSDVSNWNNAASSISSLSSIDTAAIDSVLSSMNNVDNWNNSYETVYNNSAYWENVSAISSISGTIYQTISSISSYLNNTKQDDIYFSNISLSGDGTFENKIGVKNWQDIIDMVEFYLSTSAISDQVETNIDDINNILERIAGLSAGHIQNFELIQELLGKISNVEVIWKYDSAINVSDFSTIYDKTSNDTIYYNYYEG